MYRLSSPCGDFSILMTSAPMSASMRVQVGPAMTWVRSMTFKPDNGPTARSPFLRCDVLPDYSPAHCGGRLLRNASMPSRKSRLM